MKHKDFEDFLTQKFADEVRYTENDPLDDDWPDAFNDWLCDLGPDDWIKYGDEYFNTKEIV